MHFDDDPYERPEHHGYGHPPDHAQDDDISRVAALLFTVGAVILIGILLMFGKHANDSAITKSQNEIAAAVCKKHAGVKTIDEVGGKRKVHCNDGNSLTYKKALARYSKGCQAHPFPYVQPVDALAKYCE